VDSFTQLAGNIRDMCALANTGKLYCWGNNTYGQLGNGNNISSTSPTEVLLPDGVKRFTQITGNSNTFCALGDNSQAYCWGQNSKGKFGNGTLKSSLLPTPVSLPTGVTSYKEIRLGLYHGCAVANTDAIYCWGDNSYGRLGNGTTKRSLIPVLVNY
jgi:alpha-tubulin suppressor-like RCC1 family protein